MSEDEVRRALADELIAQPYVERSMFSLHCLGLGFGDRHPETETMALLCMSSYESAADVPTPTIAAEEATTIERERVVALARIKMRKLSPRDPTMEMLDSLVQAIESGGVECDGCEGRGRIVGTDEWCGQCDGSGWHV